MRTETPIRNRFASRKFIVALAAILCATVLAHQGRLELDKWIELVKWIGLGYLGAQGAVDYIAKKGA